MMTRLKLILKVLLTAIAKRIAMVGLLMETVEITQAALHGHTIGEALRKLAVTVTGQTIDAHLTARQALLVELIRAQMVAVLRLVMTIFVTLISVSGQLTIDAIVAAITTILLIQLQAQKMANVLIIVRLTLLSSPAAVGWQHFSKLRLVIEPHDNMGSVCDMHRRYPLFVQVNT